MFHICCRLFDISMTMPRGSAPARMQTSGLGCSSVPDVPVCSPNNAGRCPPFTKITPRAHRWQPAFPHRVSAHPANPQTSKPDVPRREDKIPQNTSKRVKFTPKVLILTKVHVFFFFITKEVGKKELFLVYIIINYMSLKITNSAPQVLKFLYIIKQYVYFRLLLNVQPQSFPQLQFPQ